MISKKLGLLFLIIFPLLASASDAVLEGDESAQGLTTLHLNARVGEVEIRGIETDVVRWRVELEPQKQGWFTSNRRVRDKLGEVKVRSRTNNTTLHLDLKYPEGLNEDDIKHQWYLEIPAAFSADIKQDVGNLKVADINGGVNGELGVGNAEVTVPAGSVSLQVGTGNAKVVSATSSVGTIELQSGLGNANAQIDNNSLASTLSGLKADLNHVGNGDDDYRISVGVGNAQLEVKTTTAARRE